MHNFFTLFFQQFLIAQRVKENIKKNLKKGIGDNSNLNIDGAVDYSGRTGSAYSDKIIKTQRDVIRFCNSFLFDIEKLQMEVNVIDFYLVQLIKLKFQNIYVDLANNQFLFFKNEDKGMQLRKRSEEDITQYAEAFGRFNKNNSPSTSENDPFVLDIHLGHNNLTDFEKRLLKNIISDLLIEKKESGSINKDFSSFSNSVNYHKYFTIQNLDSDFSISDFNKYYSGTFNEFKIKLQEWIKNNQLAFVIEKLGKVIVFKSKNEWENHLKILIEIARQQLEIGGIYSINYIGIIDVINYPYRGDDKLIFFNDMNDYSNFIKNNFFEKPESPYLIESSLLYIQFSGGQKILAYKYDEQGIQTQLLDYLRKYANEKNEFRTLLLLFWNCQKRPYPSSNDIQNLPEAQKIVREQFEKNLTNENLGPFFIHQNSPGDDFYFLQTSLIESIFLDLEKFIQFIQNGNNKIELDKDSYGEFLSFLNVIKENNYAPVKFEFKYLKPLKYYMASND